MARRASTNRRRRRPRDREVASSNPSGGATLRDVAAWEPTRRRVGGVRSSRGARASSVTSLRARRRVPWPRHERPRDACPRSRRSRRRARPRCRIEPVTSVTRGGSSPPRTDARSGGYPYGGTPDKFHADRGRRASVPKCARARGQASRGETHADAISRRVYDVAQGVNDAWTAFQAQWIRAVGARGGRRMPFRRPENARSEPRSTSCCESIAPAFDDRIEFLIGCERIPHIGLFLTGGKKSDWEGLAKKYLR